MRIIHVLHSHGYGGAENHALILMKGQRAAGHEVMFAGPLDSWLARACQEEGIAAVHLRMAGMYDVFSHVKLRRLARKWQADIVHGHLIRGSKYAGTAGHRHRRPLAVCTAHSTNARNHMDRCAHIIAVSGAVQYNLVRHGRPPSDVTVVFNGVPDGPLGDRTALRRELGIANDCFAVVHVGRFMADKGQDLLVRAVMQQPDPNLRLYLIGDPATDFGRAVQALPQDADRVRYLAFRNDVQRILPAFDAFALPSRREAISLAVIEAFAASLPVVAAAVGGVPEIVLDGKTGLLVPPEDPVALAKALTRLRGNVTLAHRLARAGRQFYEQHLTAAAMVNNTLSVYRQCLSQLEPPRP